MKQRKCSFSLFTELSVKTWNKPREIPDRNYRKKELYSSIVSPTTQAPKLFNSSPTIAVDTRLEFRPASSSESVYLKFTLLKIRCQILLTIQEMNTDIDLLTESWLYSNGYEVFLQELTPIGYILYHLFPH